MKEYVCAIDIGGTKINTSIVNKKGEVIKSKIFKTEGNQKKEYIINNIKNSIYTVIKESLLDLEDIKGIGVAAPGIVDSERGIIVLAPNIKEFCDINIKEELNKEFNKTIKLENDCNAAALGESKYGSGKGFDNFIYMTISTGIGGGVIIGGKLYRGANGNAGEFGHMTIDLNGPKCGCGNIGCFEALASGTAIARIANQVILESVDDSLLKEKPFGQLRSEDIFEAAIKGDNLALEILNKEAFYIGVGIANIINVYNPQRIAIGGGVSQNLDILIDKINETVKDRALKYSNSICEIVPSVLEYNSVILGAASLIFYDEV